MKQLGCFDAVVSFFRQVLESLPDKRTGKNTRYGMEDAALSAFSVFFSQTPSFLAYQPNRGGHGIKRELLIDELTHAGFQVVRIINDWNGDHYGVLFRKNPSAGKAGETR